MFSHPIADRQHAFLELRRGIVDLADWEFYRDFERLLRDAGTRVVCEMVLEHGAVTCTRTELQCRLRRFVAAFCPLKERK